MCNCKKKQIAKSTGAQSVSKPSAVTAKKTAPARRPASVKRVVVRRPL